MPRTWPYAGPLKGIISGEAHNGIVDGRARRARWHHIGLLGFNLGKFQKRARGIRIPWAFKKGPQQWPWKTLPLPGP